MTPPRLMSSLAFASTLAALRPDVAAAALLLPTALLMPRIQAGERADAVILTREGVATLAADGVLDPGSCRDLAISSVGLAVAAGAPRPSVATVAGVVAALLGARSLALSRAGASGIYAQGLLARLGIAGPVLARAVWIDSGYTAALLGSGHADLALQQVSELLMVPGIQLLGALPEGLGAETVFSGGVFAGAPGATAAAALLDQVAGAHHALRRHGLAPV